MTKQQVRNKIKSGKLPAYTLVKDPKDDTKLETAATFRGRKRLKMVDSKPEFAPKQKRTWRLISTIVLLGDDT